MNRVAVVGGGIAGLAAAYELSRQGVAFTLFEKSGRAGGTIETAHVALPGCGDFTVELGPDGWVSEKHWARELAGELGLSEQITGSNDDERLTWLLRGTELLAVPEGMRMMVPTDLAAMRPGALLSERAIRAFHEEVLRTDELRKSALSVNDEADDISVGNFVRRHFGKEVTRTLAAPLLAGIFGGDIEKLSARSVMPAFVAMERDHGSLVAALRDRDAPAGPQTIFTTLRSGLEALATAMQRAIPSGSIALNTAVTKLERNERGWRVAGENFTHVFLATPPHVTRQLLAALDTELSALHDIAASSAVVVALLFDQRVHLPRGFGLLAELPSGFTDPALLATTFMHQKYPHTTPPGGMLLRVFFGGEGVRAVESESDKAISERAAAALQKIFPLLPAPVTSAVRRWPFSLPQYEVGHAARVQRIRERAAKFPGLSLLGNAYRGVGLPDLVRDGRLAARAVSPA